MTVQLKWGLRFLAVAVLALCLAPLVLDRETVFRLGAEDGPIEQGSSRDRSGCGWQQRSEPWGAPCRLAVGCRWRLPW